MCYRPVLDWSNPGLREWVRMSIPLILGVSLVQADVWIINHFASGVSGGIARLGYAKQMVQALTAVGLSAGAASMPFLASLGVKADFADFSRKVNSAVSQVAALSLALCSLVVALARPIIDLVMRGGAFHKSDVPEVALYFSILCASLFLWSVQGLYARAFYSVTDTLTPMVAATIVTCVTIPIYAVFFHSLGLLGLAIASDVGIAIQTLTLAVLLHRRRMVMLGGLDYGEIFRSLLAGIGGFAAVLFLGRIFNASDRIRELVLVLAGSIVWVAAAWVILKLTGSSLPTRLWKRIASFQ